MRIAVFFWSLELGGVEHMMVELSRALAARNHDVTLILARAPQPNEYRPDSRVRVLRLDAASTGKAVMRLSRHLRTTEYDVLYTAMPTTNVTAIIALALSGAATKLVISERSNPALEAKHSKTWRYRAAFALQPILYPKANAIVAVSHDLADDLASYARLPREMIKVIYNPAFVEKADSSESVATHPWLDDKVHPVIVAAGRLTAQKDFSTLLKAFAQLQRTIPARLIILGDGVLRSELHRLIIELGIEQSTALPGFVPDITPYLARADVFALSSIWEGFGNVLVQALGAGCTIVSTDCPNGPGEILDRGTFGTLVPVGNEAAFAGALYAAIKKPSDPAQQRQRAQMFSVSKSADAYEALFSNLLATGC
jgi:glycosyltransferase involved in cell wall biosynthesis